MIVKHPLRKNIISLPDIPGTDQINFVKERKRFELFPTIKYVIVTKTFESPRCYKVKGIPRRTKCYGVGILTTANHYYFSELHTRHQELTRSTIDVFKKVFLSRFNFSMNTKIIVTDNIHGKTDPIRSFLDIIAVITGCQVRTTNVLKMLRLLNFMYHYVHGRNNNFSITKYHCKRLIQKLIDMDRFEFITDPAWKEKLPLMVSYIRDAYLESAVGILYLSVKDQNLEYKHTAKENKLRKQINNIKDTQV